MFFLKNNGQSAGNGNPPNRGLRECGDWKADGLAGGCCSVKLSKAPCFFPFCYYLGFYSCLQSQSQGTNSKLKSHNRQEEYFRREISSKARQGQL